MLAVPAGAAGATVTATGLVEAVHIDPVAPDGLGRTALHLRTATRSYALVVGRTSLRAGTFVQVTATRRGGRLFVHSGWVIQPRGPRARRLAGSVAAARAPSAPRLAVILINFTDDTRRPFTVDGVDATVFSGASSVASYYAEQSFGQLQLTGTVFGWYTIAASSTTCDYTTWATKARAAVGAAVNDYDHVTYLFPTVNACAWAGLGDLPGSEAWINGYLQLRVLAHELGHNFGVHHANALSCSDSGGRTALDGQCGSTEYGDPFSVMGSASTRQFPAYHKAELGWLAGPSVYTVHASGTYLIAPDETGVGSPALLRIERNTDALYLDYRQPFGTAFDDFAPGAAAVAGVMIRRAPKVFDQTQPALVDATPGTSTYSDAALPVGASLVDPATGATITTVAVSPAGVTVAITLAVGGHAPSAPALVQASTSAGGVDVGWGAATDDGTIASYRVYRNGTLIGTTPGLGWRDSTPPTTGALVYAVSAVDDGGLEGEIAAAPSVDLGDAAPPTAPGALLVTLDGATVSLSWPEATDDVGVAGYLVYRDDVLIAQPTATAAVDAIAPQSLTHRYVVRARDVAGNLSIPSSPVDVLVPDVVPPTAPAAVVVVVTTVPWGATLTWQTSTDNVAVTGYRVYRDGALIATTADTSFSDGNLPSTQPATYGVSAVDGAGLESARKRTTVAAPNADHRPPAAPPRVRAAARRHGRVFLTWSAAVDDVAVARYEVVYRHRIVARTTSRHVTVRLISRQGARVAVSVRAVDTAGNRGRPRRVHVVVR